MKSTDVHGQFVWHELLTTDMAAARAFYTTIMKWTPQAWDADASYTLWMVEGSPVGGMMALPEEAKASGAPPNWLTYIGTADVDGTVQRATALGAHVLKEPDTIPSAGRFAILADPQGAVFGVVAAETPAPASSPLKLGEFSWHELATTDPVGAFEFYSALCGWQAAGANDMGPAGRYQMYGWGGAPRGGIYLKAADAAGPSYWLPYALVPDADRVAIQAAAAGGRVVNGPVEVPGGDRIAVVCDPQGAVFAVHAKAVVRRAAKRSTRKKAARKKSLKKTLKKRAARKRARGKKATPKKRMRVRRRRAAWRGAARKRPPRRGRPRKRR